MSINYSNLTCTQLKKTCKNLGIGMSGNKTILITRLNNYDERIPDDTWKKKALVALAIEKQIPWTGSVKHMLAKLKPIVINNDNVNDSIRNTDTESNLFTISRIELARQFEAFKNFELEHKKRTIPKIQYLPGNNQECAICLETMDETQEICIGKSCTHTFHLSCIKKHFNRTIDYGNGDIRSLPSTCPMCRKLFI